MRIPQRFAADFLDGGGIFRLPTDDVARTTRTGLLIQDLLETGCELYYYFTDERVSLDGAVDKFMVAARNFAAELEREKISQRTREHLMVKARQGLNAGGCCYGYDNIRVDGRVEYRINQEQAEVVREIFRRFVDGAGYTAIAKALNDEGVPPPRSGKRGTGSWAREQIRSMLRNERYVGILTWGRSPQDVQRRHAGPGAEAGVRGAADRGARSPDRR